MGVGVVKDGMAISGKGVKGKEALHVVLLNFEQGLSFRGLRS